MWRRFVSLFRKEQLDRELSDEIELHLDLLAEEKIKQGFSPKDARAAARREFGGIDRMKEAYRDARGLPLIESILADCAHGMRIMRLNLLFTATVVATLALGIGASTAVFTVASAVLLQPLQMPNANSLVVLLSANTREGKAFSVAEGVFADWRERAISFEDMAGCWQASMIMSSGSQPRGVSTIKTTAQFFSIAGLRPIEGRVFDALAEQPGRDDVAVLDEGFWQREFGGRRQVLGGRITLDDRPYTIIGVLPSGFTLAIFGTQTYGFLWRLAVTLAAGAPSMSLPAWGRASLVMRLRLK